MSEKDTINETFLTDVRDSFYVAADYKFFIPYACDDKLNYATNIFDGLLVVDDSKKQYFCGSPNDMDAFYNFQDILYSEKEHLEFVIASFDNISSNFALNSSSFLNLVKDFESFNLEDIMGNEVIEYIVAISHLYQYLMIYSEDYTLDIVDFKKYSLVSEYFMKNDMQLLKNNILDNSVFQEITETLISFISKYDFKLEGFKNLFDNIYSDIYDSDLLSNQNRESMNLDVYLPLIKSCIEEFNKNYDLLDLWGERVKNTVNVHYPKDIKRLIDVFAVYDEVQQLKVTYENIPKTLAFVDELTKRNELIKSYKGHLDSCIDNLDSHKAIELKRIDDVFSAHLTFANNSMKNYLENYGVIDDKNGFMGSLAQVLSENKHIKSFDNLREFVDSGGLKEKWTTPNNPFKMDYSSVSKFMTKKLTEGRLDEDVVEAQINSFIETHKQFNNIKDAQVAAKSWKVNELVDLEDTFPYMLGIVDKVNEIKLIKDKIKMAEGNRDKFKKQFKSVIKDLDGPMALMESVGKTEIIFEKPSSEIDSIGKSMSLVELYELKNYIKQNS